jgi:hypothetical protein
MTGTDNQVCTPLHSRSITAQIASVPNDNLFSLDTQANYSTPQTSYLIQQQSPIYREIHKSRLELQAFVRWFQYVSFMTLTHSFSHLST